MTLVVAIICPSMSVLWHSKCERGGKRGRRVRHTKGVCSATRGGGERGWRDPVATLLHLAYCTEEWVVKQQPSFLQTSCAFLFSACYKENLAPLAADLWKKNQTCLNKIKLVWIGSKVSKLVQTQASCSSSMLVIKKISSIGSWTLKKIRKSEKLKILCPQTQT